MKFPPFLEVANNVPRVTAPNLREMSPLCKPWSTDTNAIYRGIQKETSVLFVGGTNLDSIKYGK